METRHYVWDMEDKKTPTILLPDKCTLSTLIILKRMNVNLSRPLFDNKKIQILRLDWIRLSTKGVSCYCPFKGKGKSEKQVKKEEVAKTKNDTTAAATAKIKENKKDKKEWSSPPQ
jgi:hypothetical protein